MSDLNPRLKKCVILKLEEDLSSKELIPNGRNLWLLDVEKKEWFINVTCNGLMEFNTRMAKDYSNLFSLDFKIFSKILKEWFEKKFGIRINSSQRRTPDLTYMIDVILASKKGGWEMNERYGFSYDVVKKFLEIKKINKRVLVEDFSISL